MKKWISLLLALVLLLALGACGSSGEEKAAGSVDSSEDAEQPTEDLIAVEWLSLTPMKNDDTGVMVRIRNLSDETKDRIGIDIQALDEAGDVITSTSVSVTDADPGQAVTDEGIWTLQCPYEKISSLVIKKYTFWTSKGNGSYGDAVEYKFNEPVKLVFAEETEPDTFSSTTGHSYRWMSASQAAEKQEESAGFYGTWEATETQIGTDDPITVSDFENKKVYSLSDWIIVISETGELYLQTNNNSVKNSCTISSSGVTSGNNQWTLDGDRLVLTSGNQKFFYEKISDSQEFPTPEKKEILSMLVGTWKLNSGTSNGDFVFTEKTATATVNGVVFEADSICILTKEGRINISTTTGGQHISMDLNYSVENGELSLKYSGDALVKQG